MLVHAVRNEIFLVNQLFGAILRDAIGNTYGMIYFDLHIPVLNRGSDDRLDIAADQQLGPTCRLHVQHKHYY